MQGISLQRPEWFIWPLRLAKVDMSETNYIGLSTVQIIVMHNSDQQCCSFAFSTVLYNNNDDDYDGGDRKGGFTAKKTGTGRLQYSIIKKCTNLGMLLGVAASTPCCVVQPIGVEQA